MATSQLSASRLMPLHSSAIWCSSNCPNPARSWKRGRARPSSKSVKAASDVYAPLSGDVVEVNPAVVADPALVNSDPQGAGWLYKIKLANPSDFDGLMDETAYAQLIG